MITLDVVVPGLDGFATLERLRAEPATADVPVVLVTARGQGVDRLRGETLGAEAYLTKPFEPAELVDVVGRLAGQCDPHCDIGSVVLRYADTLDQ